MTNALCLAVLSLMWNLIFAISIFCYQAANNLPVGPPNWLMIWLLATPAIIVLPYLFEISKGIKGEEVE